jgi:hypothetical protein
LSACSADSAAPRPAQRFVRQERVGPDRGHRRLLREIERRRELIDGPCHARLVDRAEAVLLHVRGCDVDVDRHAQALHLELLVDQRIVAGDQRHRGRRVGHHLLEPLGDGAVEPGDRRGVLLDERARGDQGVAVEVHAVIGVEHDHDLVFGHAFGEQVELGGEVVAGDHVDLAAH